MVTTSIQHYRYVYRSRSMGRLLSFHFLSAQPIRFGSMHANANTSNDTNPEKNICLYLIGIKITNEDKTLKLFYLLITYDLV